MIGYDAPPDRTCLPLRADQDIPQEDDGPELAEKKLRRGLSLSYAQAPMLGWRWTARCPWREGGSWDTWHPEIPGNRLCSDACSSPPPATRPDRGSLDLQSGEIMGVIGQRRRGFDTYSPRDGEPCDPTYCHRQRFGFTCMGSWRTTPYPQRLVSDGDFARHVSGGLPV